MGDVTFVLFDIDGTLVHTGGAGVRALAGAFQAAHGHHDAVRGIPVAGRTDRAILCDVCRAYDVEPTPEVLQALRQAYLDRLRVELGRPPTGRIGVLPGVRRLLDGLSGRSDVEVGLLTGNFEEGARLKLAHFDLWAPFTFGAFGDEHLDRRDLVPLAHARARRAGVEALAARVVIIGDTPLDVDCAHAHGAFAIAVATGDYSEADLRHAGADLVVPTLEDLPPVPQWITGLAADLDRTS